MSIKYWPTNKIEEILFNPFIRDNKGKCYESYKEELQEILWGRLQKKKMTF